MYTLPLRYVQEHLFVELDGGLWLLDTGAPTSFGTSRNLRLAGQQFELNTDHLGCTALTISNFVGARCAGLLGGDVLGRFDHLLDLDAGRLTVSTDELPHNGIPLPLEQCTNIPVVAARIGGRDHRMVFDTGAPLSYFQHESLAEFAPAGKVTDFHPGFGYFEVETYQVDLSLGGVSFTLRCGRLPPPLDQMLRMADTMGIIGNAILRNRIVGYFPRRRRMTL